MRDPIAAILEWDRVLAPGGRMLLVLPWWQKTLDRHRSPHTMQQLLQQHTRHATGPPLLLEEVEFEQIFRLWDIEDMPDASPLL